MTGSTKENPLSALSSAELDKRLTETAQKTVEKRKAKRWPQIEPLRNDWKLCAVGDVVKRLPANGLGTCVRMRAPRPDRLLTRKYLDNPPIEERETIWDFEFVRSEYHGRVWKRVR